ncbi:hypothetical protein [Gilvimarinus sp. 1_MG-2023]|uniref:hypothetical protein n=1 Tax=Gilvimarinus sp. 1_MG-2023 TaxID=3062638 RepID=UPI0026E456ED|nr:hypothetical protein [Gilvimarinus sp. 1_MG-2023]MDO6747130.1 hypothetical protein [Gilvimarinus sp. 1_MG-2023]
MSVNDNVLYSPKPLLADIKAADPSLQSCIRQTIEDEKIHTSSQLTRLRCSYAGIESVMGIEQFYALKELDLSNNTIEDLGPIGLLGKLTTLDINHNKIIDTKPLINLLRLSDLRLTGNQKLSCDSLRKVSETVYENNGHLEQPEHCM